MSNTISAVSTPYDPYGTLNESIDPVTTLSKLTSSASKDWYAIGSNLGLSRNESKNIEEQYSDNPKRYTEVLNLAIEKLDVSGLDQQADALLLFFSKKLHHACIDSERRDVATTLETKIKAWEARLGSSGSNPSSTTSPNQMATVSSDTQDTKSPPAFTTKNQEVTGFKNQLSSSQPNSRAEQTDTSPALKETDVKLYENNVEKAKKVKFSAAGVKAKIYNSFQDESPRWEQFGSKLGLGEIDLANIKQQNPGNKRRLLQVLWEAKTLSTMMSLHSMLDAFAKIDSEGDEEKTVQLYNDYFKKHHDNFF